MNSWSERFLIEKIRQANLSDYKGLVRSIGDDCCQVTTSGSLLVTTDTLVDGVHFDRAFHPPHLLGRKTIAVNLSDIAAMGGQPLFVQLSLCLPKDMDGEWIDHYLDGVFAILKEYDIALTGGDTVKGKQLVVTVTAFGEPTGSGAIYRDGAREGDSVWVSGALGSAGCGLELFLREKKTPGSCDMAAFQPLLDAHLNPRPRIRLGRELAGCGVVTSMQDISDGLATDLAHICLASGVSAHIESDLLPFIPELAAASKKLGLNREDLLLCAGEDYELVFTVREGEADTFSQVMEKSGCRLTRIGVIRGGQGVFLLNEGEAEEISFQGYEH